MKNLITMKMPDGTTWAVDVEDVVISRADHYKSEFDGDITRSMDEDTIPLFEESEYEIMDWAFNNMNWDNFKCPRKIADAPALTPRDFQDAWCSADKDLA